jgi:hypothetical protein
MTRGGHARRMHASLLRFSGDPDRLLSAYESVLGEIPGESLVLHLCLRAPDGILVVDTCPSRDAFERFFGGGTFARLRERHGLPEPAALDDYPVHAAFAAGERVAAPVTR